MGVTPICLCYLQYFVEFPIIAIHKGHVHFVQTTTPPMSVDTMLVFSNSSPSLLCLLLLAIHYFYDFMQNSALPIRHTLNPNRSPILDWASSWTARKLGNTIPEHNTSLVTS